MSEQTYNGIQTKVTELLVQLFVVRLVALMKQSDSSWSRANVVIVVDDSIFKQWLKNGEHCEFFDKFFSGQTHKTEYGFQLLLIGVSINDEFCQCDISGLCTKRRKHMIDFVFQNIKTV